MGTTENHNSREAAMLRTKDHISRAIRSHVGDRGPTWLAVEVNTRTRSLYTRQAAAAWIDGRVMPRPEIMLAICDALGIDPNALLGWDTYRAVNRAA
jgi:2-hydroxychromene-2-carboxylate isomerase